MLGKRKLTSESNKMAVSFNAEYPLASNGYAFTPSSKYRKGFKLCYKISE